MASGERQGQLWSAAPRDWAELQEPFCRPLWQDTLSALGVKAGVRFLDAGCGGGGACVLAAALGCEVTGFDASNALLTIARERLPQAQLVHGDLEQLPFPDGHFDAALAANSVIFAEDTVMMRLVFLFSAEERSLLLLGDPLYDQHYAVSTLRDQLPELEARQGAVAGRHPEDESGIDGG